MTVKWSRYGQRKGSTARIADSEYRIEGLHAVYDTTYILLRRLSYYGWEQIATFPTLEEARRAAEARHA